VSVLVHVVSELTLAMVRHSPAAVALIPAQQAVSATQAAVPVPVAALVEHPSAPAPRTMEPKRKKRKAWEAKVVMRCGSAPGGVLFVPTEGWHCGDLVSP